jgi:hypothetical protein
LAGLGSCLSLMHLWRADYPVVVMSRSELHGNAWIVVTSGWRGAKMRRNTRCMMSIKCVSYATSSKTQCRQVASFCTTFIYTTTSRGSFVKSARPALYSPCLSLLGPHPARLAVLSQPSLLASSSPSVVSSSGTLATSLTFNDELG